MEEDLLRVPGNGLLGSYLGFESSGVREKFQEAKVQQFCPRPSGIWGFRACLELGRVREFDVQAPSAKCRARGVPQCLLGSNSISCQISSCETQRHYERFPELCSQFEACRRSSKDASGHGSILPRNTDGRAPKQGGQTYAWGGDMLLSHKQPQVSPAKSILELLVTGTTHAMYLACGFVPGSAPSCAARTSRARRARPENRSRIGFPSRPWTIRSPCQARNAENLRVLVGTEKAEGGSVSLKPGQL